MDNPGCGCESAKWYGVSCFRLFRIACFYFLLAYTGYLTAETRCELSASTIAIGKQQDVIVCGDQFKAASALTAHLGDKVTLNYQQALKRCDVGDKRAGYHLVLEAAGKPRTESLRLTDTASGEVLCTAAVNIVKAVKKPAYRWQQLLTAVHSRTIKINGINTRYFDIGKGRPVVLVHGGNAGGTNNNAFKWEQNIEGLSQHYRVIALDRLGQGQTANFNSPDDYAEYFKKDAEHLRDFVIALDLQDAILIGHSQGGWPVTRTALDIPDRVSCLVNVDTLMVPDEPKLMREALQFIIYVSSNLHPSSGPSFFSARRGMSLRYPSGNGITDEKAQRVVDQFNDPKAKQAKQYMRQYKVSPMSPQFKQQKAAAYDAIASGGLTMKNLVIWGEKDPQVPLGLGKLFQQMLVDNQVESSLAVIKEAGHAPFVEFPRRFNKLVIEGC